MYPYPIVSIITACYNAEPFITHTIESVLAQTYEKWELIIVDDCSTDRSARLIKEYQKKDSRITYLKMEKPSGSPTLPRNRGIKEAKGRYIAFLDSDDLWLPTKLEEQLSIIVRAGIAIVFSNYEKINKEGKRSERVITAPSMVNYSLLLKGNCIGCLTAMYDTAKVGKVFFKERGHEDYLLWLTILRKGFQACNTNTVTALYRIGNHSISSNKWKVLPWQWKILRKEEHLPFYKAIYCYIHYAVKAFIKVMK